MHVFLHVRYQVYGFRVIVYMCLIKNILKNGSLTGWVELMTSVNFFFFLMLHVGFLGHNENDK